MAEPRFQVNIDTELWGTVHSIFTRAVMSLPDNVFLVDERNGFTNDALSVFPLCLNAFEAYYNTQLLSTVPYFHLSPSGGELLSEHREALAGLNLSTRVLLLTRIACGQTFDQGGQPFQDFSNLVKIRNAIVHFQMQDAPLKVVDNLTQRGLAWPEKIGGTSWAWVQRISTVECMRWAINTVAEMTVALQQLIGSDMVGSLHGVSEADISRLLAARKEKNEAIKENNQPPPG